MCLIPEPQALYKRSVQTDKRFWEFIMGQLGRQLARCPEVEDRQGTAVLATLVSSWEDASLSEPVRFWVDIENCARWRPLCPEAPGVAGLTDRSPEGTEERQAPPPPQEQAVSAQLPNKPHINHCSSVSCHSESADLGKGQREGETISNPSTRSMLQSPRRYASAKTAPRRDSRELPPRREPSESKACAANAHPESSTPITTLPPLSLKDSLQFCVDKRQVAAVTDIGGATVDEATKRMMTFLLDHALSRQYNFLGRNGKREFKALKLYEVIYGGLKKNAMTSQITRKDAEKAVSKWLIGARDRGGNRQARQATPQQGL
ncbi:hypothetical protein Q8A67_015562 [Cirrhinus molitorella]|uniref:DUF4806 domain-containing protein n=1 Tax=Cirrhinus molitorella TaxID=172907 RepID=A0AA88PEY9_9TELE|nr:hypothetical protein Q8A67_015562 [Cirrhinus molitorella]